MLQCSVFCCNALYWSAVHWSNRVKQCKLVWQTGSRLVKEAACWLPNSSDLYFWYFFVSVTRRCRTRRSHSLTGTVEPTWLLWPWWVKIPTEDFTDETLAIDDTRGDDVIGGDWGADHWGWQGGRWGDRHGSWQGNQHVKFCQNCESVLVYIDDEKEERT